jgi:hypothetical protein
LLQISLPAAHLQLPSSNRIFLFTLLWHQHLYMNFYKPKDTKQ